MSAARELNYVSVDDYLAGELESVVKHEYVDGIVYAMAGTRNTHNAIATNAIVELGLTLRGKPCRPFNSDTKIRIRQKASVTFYYPDASVICQPNPGSESFQDQPVVIVEVLSPSTRRIDEGEKREAYLSIPTLMAYLLVDQNKPEVVVHRRGERGFAPEVYRGIDSVIPLPEIEAELALAALYSDVEFKPQSDDDPQNTESS